ncbi:PREDICTED: bis(5'-nucleosyl)-tetraphosphatase [asymmetrical] [Polistes dominula]|uniref:Bis(5'-nucleosyl)-tetraphosphatase [asymmetrical] n=1 Tax=Polistes dominula TaxID=743375 RepID=A0ABM1I6I3_POLDO|nr:PREDICTED: bis(5'-nucleosyl)-tetraphosphatase [asymmetrical] [Polistes dominula]
MLKRASGFVIFRQIKDSIEYLLLQTSYGNHHWTPPKGHIDGEESAYEAALRETEEEAGFVEDDLKIIDNANIEIQYNVNGVPKIVTYFLAELINPNQSVRMSNEHQAYKWLRFQEACNLAEYAEMQNVLKHFNEYIDKNIKKK